jgi:hypothetical protein
MKLDIEGAESAALKGMSRTIARKRPRLAISAYHKPGDIWDLARQTSELVSGYSIHLRQHGANAFDTVVYAIP